MSASDLDQGGTLAQKVKVWLGPSLGWVEQQVRPELFVTAGGTINILPGQSVVHVNAIGVTLLLPDVVAWMKETAYNPVTGYERALWIKDLGGNAAGSPIVIVAQALQSIDTIFATISITTNFGIVRLYPLGSLVGWYQG